MTNVDEALLPLLEDLVATLELRDAADPDVPRWEADRRVRQLEDELVTRFRRVEIVVTTAKSSEESLGGVF